MLRHFILLLLGTLAVAEISIENSIEWSVVDSELIVRGRVVAVKSAAIERDTIWHRVTVKVEETLKGKAQAHVEFIVEAGQKDTHLQEWRDRKTEMVCFLVNSARYAKDDRHLAKAPWALHDDDENDGIVRLEGDRMWYLIDRESVDYHTRGAMLAAIRRAVRAMSKKARLKGLTVEHPIAPSDKAPLAGPQYIVVPVDARLEAQAHRLLKQKKPKWRVKGVRVLRYFKSKGNVELLKKLLGDESYVGVSAPGDHSVLDHLAGEKRLYCVRLAAYGVLRGWGEAVARPVIFESGN